MEQKNFTHVRQLLGYGRFADLRLKSLVDDLYEKAWLPLRNHFTPVMKLVEKQRIAGKVRKIYDKPATPCDRLLACDKVPSATKAELRALRAKLDPLALAQEIERRLSEIFTIAEEIQDDSWQENALLGGLRRSPPTCLTPFRLCSLTLAYARLRSLTLAYARLRSLTLASPPLRQPRRNPTSPLTKTHTNLTIADYLVERNLEPKAYKWRADGKEILEKIQRAREAMAKNNV